MNLHSNRSAKNLLLTGNPGVGKTTVVRKTLEQLNAHVGGFFTEEIRQEGQRVGFKIVTLYGTEGLLAHVNLSSPYRVGRYGVNVADMERVAVSALERALKEAQLIVIDEIGRMELYCPPFQRAILRCLDSAKPVLAVIQRRQETFLDEIRRREDVELIEVTLPNRDVLPDVLIARLRDCGIASR